MHPAISIFRVLYFRFTSSTLFRVRHTPDVPKALRLENTQTLRTLRPVTLPTRNRDVLLFRGTSTSTERLHVIELQLIAFMSRIFMDDPSTVKTMHVPPLQFLSNSFRNVTRGRRLFLTKRLSFRSDFLHPKRKTNTNVSSRINPAACANLAYFRSFTLSP